MPSKRVKEKTTNELLWEDLRNQIIATGATNSLRDSNPDLFGRIVGVLRARKESSRDVLSTNFSVGDISDI